ncbi:hypothetical protein POM88_031993 [Heracleum sosnowskyi]|uniref:Uncharacterized protein n=1 Tax=Heracleum sosnowskyi TaxID=360622 RepID=A0AAD8HZ98_9APIA|nr:hypothetical protein POM88_031993 [Heracleum sosnowskyi]
MQRAIGHWGHSGALISGAANIFVNEFESWKEAKKEKDSRIENLENQLSSLRVTCENQIADLNAEVSGLKVKVADAEKESGALKKENEDLNLEILQSKEDIIAEFKKSSAYDQALADVSAPEVYQTFVVAEKHLKTDPNASWESFIDHFVADKKGVEDGLGEPTPYDGPNPFVISPSTDSPQPSNRINQTPE